MTLTASDMDLRDIRNVIGKMSDGRTDSHKDLLTLIRIAKHIARRQDEISASLAEAVALMKDGQKKDTLTLKRLWSDYLQPGGLILGAWLASLAALRHAWNGGDIGTALSGLLAAFS